MNDKDKEAFDKWFENNWQDSDDKDLFTEAWQAACEYKDKSIREGSKMKQMNEDIERLKAENAKLRECIEWYADRKNCDNADFSHVEIDDSGEEIADGGYRARQVLKELEE